MAVDFYWGGGFRIWVGKNGAIRRGLYDRIGENEKRKGERCL